MGCRRRARVITMLCSRRTCGASRRRRPPVRCVRARRRRRDARSLPKRHRFDDEPLRIIIGAPPLFFPLLAQVLGVLREHDAHHGRHPCCCFWWCGSCPAIDCSPSDGRGLLVNCGSLLRLLGRMQARFQSLPGQQSTHEKLEIEGTGPAVHHRRDSNQNTQPYARYLDVHDDVQVAPIRLLVDLHRGVRDRFDFCSLGMLLQIKLLSSGPYGGLEGWFALMYFD